MKISARNALAGTVQKLTLGPVNAEVVIELAGGSRIVSVITRTSAKNLGLKRGKTVVAVIKSSDVMVGVCCGNPDCRCAS